MRETSGKSFRNSERQLTDSVKSDSVQQPLAPTSPNQKHPTTTHPLDHTNRQYSLMMCIMNDPKTTIHPQPPSGGGGSSPSSSSCRLPFFPETIAMATSCRRRSRSGTRASGWRGPCTWIQRACNATAAERLSDGDARDVRHSDAPPLAR